MKVHHFKEINISVVEGVDGQAAIVKAMQNIGSKGTKSMIVNELNRMGASASLQKTFSRGINKLSDAKRVTKVHEKGEWWYVLLEVPKEDTKAVITTERYYDHKLRKWLVVLDRQS